MPAVRYGVGLMWFFSTLGDPGTGLQLHARRREHLELQQPRGDVAHVAGQRRGRIRQARIDLLVQAETLQARDVINVPLWWGQSATAF